MKLTSLTYTLPEGHIAHSPSVPRDHSKLLLCNRTTKELSDAHFYDILNYLHKGDVLVLNDTKVFPARLLAKKSTGGTIELLLLNEIAEGTWHAMHRGKVLIGQVLNVQDAIAEVIAKNESIITLKFNVDKSTLNKIIAEHGEIPLPPYIHSTETEETRREKYQTVFAKESGSVAAPTAGLHFTDDLLKKIQDKGVQIEYVTLHVGMGTFLPIKEQDITKHPMHSEYYSIGNGTAVRLNSAKKRGARIISVGTTTTRVLETVANDSGELQMNALSGATNIFIYPPYQFKFVNALITNFHLPHSTLLALISALVSTPNTADTFTNFSSSFMGKAYMHAIEANYKFYSFGDACFIF